MFPAGSASQRPRPGSGPWQEGRARGHGVPGVGVEGSCGRGVGRGLGSRGHQCGGKPAPQSSSLERPRWCLPPGLQRALPPSTYTIKTGGIGLLGKAPFQAVLGPAGQDGFRASPATAPARAAAEARKVPPARARHHPRPPARRYHSSGPLGSPRMVPSLAPDWSIGGGRGLWISVPRARAC